MRLKSDVGRPPSPSSQSGATISSLYTYIHFYRQSCCWIMRASFQGESPFRLIVIWSQSGPSGGNQMIRLSANTFPTSTELSWNIIRKKTENLTMSLRDVLELSVTWCETENDSGEEDDDDDDDDDDGDGGKLWQDSFLIPQAFSQTKAKGQISFRSFIARESENLSLRWIEKWLASDSSRWRPASVCPAPAVAQACAWSQRQLRGW